MTRNNSIMVSRRGRGGTDGSDAARALGLLRATIGEVVQIGDGVSVTVKKRYGRGHGAQECIILTVIEVLLQTANAVAIGVAANWIYEKLKGRNFSLHINDQRIELEHDAIAKALEEGAKSSSEKGASDSGPGSMPNMC